MVLLLKRFILAIILSIFAILLAQEIIPGFQFLGSFWLLIQLGGAIALLNLLLKPFLKIIFLPFIWLTFGFFSLVINMIILKAASLFYPELIISTFLVLFLASIVISLVNYPLQWIK